MEVGRGLGCRKVRGSWPLTEVPASVGGGVCPSVVKTPSPDSGGSGARDPPSAGTTGSPMLGTKSKQPSCSPARSRRTCGFFVAVPAGVVISVV